jgi:hypothetical protein
MKQSPQRQWTENDLRQQFVLVLQNKWWPFFKEAGAAFDLPLAHLIAIPSRETNMRNILGVFGNLLSSGR